MALILDTNALSGFADGDVLLHRALGRETDLAIPSIVLGEYFFAIRQSKYRSRYEKWLHGNLALFLVLAVGPDTAACYAEVRAELRTSGQPIPTNDLWIASVALEHGWPLASRDAHFSRVPRLRLVTW